MAWHADPPAAAPPAVRSPCPDCGASAPGRYCPECGQRQGELAVSVRAWLRDVAQETLELDGALPQTLRALFLGPGHLTAEWLVGRRTRYVRPARLYLFAAFVFYLIWPLLEADRGILSALLVNVMGHPRDVVSFVANATPALMILLLVPSSAAILRPLLPRHSRHYASSLVFALHYHAFLFFLMVLLTPWTLVAGGRGEPMLATVLGGVAYLVLALRGTWGFGWTRALASGIALAAAYAGIFLAVLHAAAVAYRFAG